MNVCADTSPSAAFSQQAKAIFVQFPRVSIEHPNESRTDAVAFLIRSRVEKEAPLGNGGGGAYVAANFRRARVCIGASPLRVTTLASPKGAFRGPSASTRKTAPAQSLNSLRSEQKLATG
jgi:hypothetical protein